jgi:hypothetical protein
LILILLNNLEDKHFNETKLKINKDRKNSSHLLTLIAFFHSVVSHYQYEYDP